MTGDVTGEVTGEVPATRRLPPLTVRLDAAEAATFAAAIAPTGSPTAPAVPLTFPIAWLGLPPVRAALADLVDLAACAILHESQTFDCARPLHPGATYSLHAEITRQDGDPPRITIAAAIHDAAGQAARLTTLLRAVAPRAARPAP